MSVAVIVGAGWVLYTFSALEQANTAQAQLKKLELDSKVQAAGSAEIQASQVWLPGDRGRYLSAVFTLWNTGTRNVVLDFSEKSPFTVTPVNVDKNGKLLFGKSIVASTFREDNFTKPAGGANVRAGGRVTYSVFVRVPGPGLYVVAFSSYIRPDEITDIPLTKKPFWGTSRFFVVS